MAEFSYVWSELGLTVEKLTLTGNLDRSIDPENNPQIKKLSEEFKKRVSAKVIIIDLSAFSFWDTEGIRAIIGQIVYPAASKGHKVAFVGPKHTKENLASGLSQLYEDAKIKFNIIGTKQVPWEEDLEGVAKELNIVIRQ